MQKEGLNLHSGKRVGGAFPVVQACTSRRACFPSPRLATAVLAASALVAGATELSAACGTRDRCG
jgi:hypothetical protein